MSHQPTLQRTVLSCEPWPAQGIRSHSRLEDYQWGYLLYYSDGQFEFDLSKTPDKLEITQRWGIYFDGC